MLFALTGLLAYAQHRPTENPLHPFRPQPQVVENSALFLLFAYFFFFIAIKEEKVTKKKKKRTVFYNLAVVVWMDVADFR